MGGPSAAFLKKHGLNEFSHPMDWWTSIMPLTPADNLEDAYAANVKGDRVSKFSVANWCSYTNTKASIVNAGEPGHIFSGKYKPFSIRGFFQMIGVYIVDGLSPTPELTRKMQPQSKERTHGNDFIAQHIGTGYQQMYCTFQNFFACQDPLTTPPPAQECPNYKVDEFLRWLRYIMPKAWNLSKNFSVDE